MNWEKLAFGLEEQANLILEEQANLILDEIHKHLGSQSVETVRINLFHAGLLRSLAKCIDSARNKDA
jgi:hypothetical protein